MTDLALSPLDRRPGSAGLGPAGVALLAQASRPADSARVSSESGGEGVLAQWRQSGVQRLSDVRGRRPT